MSDSFLEPLLDRKKSLQAWTEEGSISSAAQDALALQGKQTLLNRLASMWRKGAFIDLPSTELLDEAIARGTGTYVNSTNAMNSVHLIIRSKSKL